MTREAKAIELLRRFMDCYNAGIPDTNGTDWLINEIMAFLGEIEAEERDVLRK